MNNNEREKYVNCKSLDEILDVEYGPRGGQRKENGSRLLQNSLYLCQENECVQK